MTPKALFFGSYINYRFFHSLGSKIIFFKWIKRGTATTYNCAINIARKVIKYQTYFTHYLKPCEFITYNTRIYKVKTVIKIVLFEVHTETRILRHSCFSNHML